MTTHEENQALVMRFFELLDTHQFDRFDEVLAPDLQLHIGVEDMGRAEAEEMIRMVYTAFPDFTHDVADIFASGDRVVARAMDHCTHEGEFLGIAPTGRRLSMGQIAIYRIEAGRIAEIWEERDAQRFFEQLRSSTAAVEAEIEARYRRWSQCEVDGDLDTWLGFVAPDVVQHPPGEAALVGEAACKEWNAAFFELPIVEIEAIDHRVHVSAEHDMACNVGDLRVVLDGATGRETHAMKAIAVWRKVDDVWQVVANSWSANEGAGGGADA